jgi:mevalonate kinase
MPAVTAVTAVTAIAPGKVILFGEHAVNREQPALAASVGLYATCRLETTEQPGVVFRSDAPGRARATATWDEIHALRRAVDAWRAAEDYDAIRRLAAADFFAPQKYVLATAAPAATGRDLPASDASLRGLDVTFTSDIPVSSGLGSGGAAFAALATALAAWAGGAERERVADWAHRGDVVAHGGVASRLDSQTSLCGGVIRFTAERGLGEPVEVAPGMTLVIGNTRVRAATAGVNVGVRRWLAADPARRRYFEAIGTLSRAAVEPLCSGDWPQLGSLMTLNQVLLEKIGVSSPEIERLVAAALGAGALGAKLAGSGGGGIVVALAETGTSDAVAAAIAAAGGDVLAPAIGVRGARIQT